MNTEKVKEQLRMPYVIGVPVSHFDGDTHAALKQVISGDLDFHGATNAHAAHRIHSFPAKFPPQLPRVFIEALTSPGDIVLDPMSGSGTTILESYLAGRQAIGFDIDPLALRIAKAKTTPLDKHEVAQNASKVILQALAKLKQQKTPFCKNGHDEETQEFIEYWFMPNTVCELISLTEELSKVESEEIRSFLELALSATIITKSGGVSLALDLAHTRPHKAKVVVNTNGEILLGENRESVKHRALIKTLRSATDEFKRRVQQNLQSLVELGTTRCIPIITEGNSQQLALNDCSIDLIVTSPPYASNAIDYMRAHKFSLIWLGHSISSLGKLRNDYIGGESISHFEFEPLPDDVNLVINAIALLDTKKASALKRYYSEMRRSLSEMYRVLKPGKAAIIVVGNSIMRGTDTKVPECLASIGQTIGFEKAMIGVRNLDRDKRMLPSHRAPDLDSQIQQRMHQEYVIGFIKP